jgi:hypothetical protein
MIVYYDMISDVEICSDAFDQKLTEGYKGVREVQSKKVEFKEVEADIGANASKGDGEKGEDDDEGDEGGVAESEAVSVINVVHAANLTKMDLSQKEYTSMQKAYWKRLIEQHNRERYKALGINVTEDDDKDTIKEKEAAAFAELSKYELKAVEDAKARLATFKENFEDLQKFVKEVVIANFDEYHL